MSSKGTRPRVDSPLAARGLPTDLPFRERPEVQQLILSGLALLGVIAFGTTGYVVIEGWSVFDSLYMTVITLATIGYGETHPLSTAGRAFTILLILFGVGFVTVVIGAWSKALLDRQASRIFDKKRRIMDRVQTLSDHTIFCGFSRLSRVASREIQRAGDKVVVIEINEARAAEAESNGLLVVRGDATMDEALVLAGVERAARLVTLLPKDPDNLYVILTARELNPNLYIVSRTEDEVGEKRLRRAGVNRLISTYSLAARKLADGLLRPFVTDFFEGASGMSEQGWKIEEIQIPEGSPMCGKSLGELSVRQANNLSVAAIVTPQGHLLLNPAGETVVEESAILIVIGWKSDISQFEAAVVGER